MPTLTQTDALANLPISELNQSVHEFLQPLTLLLPDVRLGAVAELIVRGLVTSQSPLVTQIARGASHNDETIWPTCQRAYRFLWNERFTSRTLLKGLYRVAHQAVQTQQPKYLVIALDPVNFEKPYTTALEGVSHVLKVTPPCLKHPKRIARGYPALTATIVNLRQPATTYAHWFSYMRREFISQNRELEKAFRVTHALFSGHKIRWVADAGLDDEKIFLQAAHGSDEFVIRACHNRAIEVYNERLHRWESESLFDLVATVPYPFEQRVGFTHARKTHSVRIGFGWFQIRIPDTQQILWVLVAHNFEEDRDLILLTNIPLDKARVVRQVYTDWLLRGKIEHGYRFAQEDGLDVEDLRVETLERMRRLFVLVLLAAQFVCYLGRTWSRPAVIWLRELGGKLGLKSDRDGLSVLLRGISAVWQTVSTLQFALANPFPTNFSRCE